MTIKTLAAIAALPIIALCAGAATSAAQSPFVAKLTEGQKKFEAVCGRCHGTDRPRKMELDRKGWEAILTQMEKKGAEMTAEDKALILDYLGARAVFLSKCTTCHTKERIVDRQWTFGQWKGTVKKMAAKTPDLMSKDEAMAIIGYLSVVLGPVPAGK